MHFIPPGLEVEPLVASLAVAADTFLTKPVAPSVLVSSVSTLVRLRRAYLVTEQERAELAEIVNQMPSGVVISNAEGELLMANRRAREILCLAEIPRLPGGTDPGHEADGPGGAYDHRGVAHVAGYPRGERIVGEEFDFACGESAQVMVRVSAAPIRNPEGKIVAGVVTFTDVTALKKAEEAERTRADEAEIFRAEVDHRVKNNLAMAASLLQMQEAEETNPRGAEILADTAARLLTFANIHEQLHMGREGRVNLLAALGRLVEATPRRLRPPELGVRRGRRAL